MIKRMTLAVLCLALVAGSVQAAERKGEFALGFNSSDAPVGGRYFFSDKVAVDLGLGFEAKDVMWEDDTASATSFWVEAGVPFVLYDYGDSFFFVRPAIQYASLDDRVYGGGTVDDTWSVFTVALNLGAEVRLAERFGLTFQHGLKYTNSSPPGDGDSVSEFRTLGENVTEAGVFFTF